MQGCLISETHFLGMLPSREWIQKLYKVELRKRYRFYCTRNNEIAELGIFPGTGTLSLVIKSENILIYSLNFVNCDRVVTNLKEKKLYFTSGFEEDDRFYYIECALELNNHLSLSVEANARPGLRGLG